MKEKIFIEITKEDKITERKKRKKRLENYKSQIKKAKENN